MSVVSVLVGPTLDLEAIRARRGEATHGQWMHGHSIDGHDRDDCPVYTAEGPLAVSPDDGVRGGLACADAEFVAHAPDDVDALLAEVDRLRGIIAEGQRQLSDLLPEEQRHTYGLGHAIERVCVQLDDARSPCEGCSW